MPWVQSALTRGASLSLARGDRCHLLRNADVGDVLFYGRLILMGGVMVVGGVYIVGDEDAVPPRWLVIPFAVGALAADRLSDLLGDGILDPR
jgi:hypothetical protein